MFKACLLPLSLLLAGCGGPSSERTSGSQDRALNAIAANTSEMDGQGKPPAPIVPPTLGQRMDASGKPPPAP
ncbi:hypothetical protein [Sphingomonas bacterium]|uniref:hypothetical protein n=1 Tax=Sphingomonas bacterium TaxID=1895847 RepID=UPI0015762853|nr:hypothetical protein [Sphingomonas bacterium]